MSPPSKLPVVSVEVTEEVIAQAVRKNSGHCIIADAVRQAIPEATRVNVDLQTIRFSLPSRGRRYVFLTPVAAQHVLLDFDEGINPVPQTVKLGRPVQHVAIARNRKIEGNPRKRGGQPRDVEKHPDAKHVELVSTGHGDEAPVVVGGVKVLPVGPLADPPKMHQDPISKRRYAGQRRTFGLRMLRP